ncbi:hypothetical protein [Micromonospora tulbaghiae]
MPTSYGDTVHADFGVPDWVHADPACPPAVRDAAAALDAANDATSAARDAVYAIRDQAEDNRAAIAAAIRAGKNPPAPIPAEHTAERVRQAEQGVTAASVRARQAAKAYEEAVTDYAAELRAIVAAKLPEAAEESARKFAEARAAYDHAEAVASVVLALDNVRLSRRPATSGVEQAARQVAVDQQHKRYRLAHPLNLPGRLSRLSLAWQDVTAVATGLPRDLLTVDPLDGAA